MDLLSDAVAKKTGLDISINESAVASTSRGLVGDTVFAVIPNVKPIHTFIITLAFQIVRKISATGWDSNDETENVFLYLALTNRSY